MKWLPSESTVDIQPGIVPLQDVLDDRQTEPRTPALPRAPGIDAVEPFRQARQVLGGNSLAGVAHLEHALDAPVAPAQGDSTAGWGMVYGIDRQVGDRTAQLRGIAEHPARRQHFAADLGNLRAKRLAFVGDLVQ